MSKRMLWNNVYIYIDVHIEMIGINIENILEWVKKLLLLSQYGWSEVTEVVPEKTVHTEVWLILCKRTLLLERQADESTFKDSIVWSFFQAKMPNVWRFQLFKREKWLFFLPYIIANQISTAFWRKKLFEGLYEIVMGHFPHSLMFKWWMNWENNWLID